jgi:hypothetical protein
MKIRWDVVDALEASAAPYVADVQPIDPADDARLERAARIPPGFLAERRRIDRCVLVVIERPSEAPALAAFDPAFPGARPFCAPTRAHALSLLRALRPHAFPEHDENNFLLEDRTELAAALRGAGAKLRFVVQQMHGPISA